MNIAQVDIKIDVTALRDKLIAHPELFGTHPNRIVAENSPHRESSDIWVRYGDYDKLGENVFIEEHDSVWYQVLNDIPEVVPIVFQLMSRVLGERLGGVLITKLPKGKKIYSHIDTIGWHPAYYQKFYIPISNKPGAVFGFEDDGEIAAKEGEAYWFRNDVPHWVNNDSDEDRIAMVVAIKPYSGDINDK